MACKYRDKSLHDNILAKKNATSLRQWYFSYNYIRENRLYSYYKSNDNLVREMG
jgi:hypothetical protein